MNSTSTMILTLADRFWPRTNRALRNALLALAGTIALWISAKLQVPFYPVPMTMQTFVVLVIGMAFGWRLGVGTVILYLAEGLAGLPVFAGTPERGLGLAYMLGPTGGYLVGFVAAAALTGWLAQRGWDRGVATTLLATALGTFVIYAFGVAWLGIVIGWDKPLLEVGVLPFLPADLFKMVLAAAVLPLAWRVLNKG